MEQTDKRKQDKLKFDRVINLARRLPQPAIHDLPRFYVSTSKSIIKALINMHSFEIQLSPIG
ncbi:hypothetical protein [Salmonella enterica]|uniref:hypothetical protein n=1 Tax=Salmonella enterica TaxID=28901 RepID=UPI0019883F6A|nr:hypothetical protein [Salmonella enterica]MCW9094163.1 hypothetical protein [Salmonella enterica]MCW9103170.1 hypothetical protein [Salmonella enterica]MCW9111611.1 hypothetical protein [Salmonella enterica]